MSVTSSQAVTGSATVSFWFSMMPVVSTSSPASYSMTWVLGFYLNGVWQSYQGSLPMSFFGPENVASLQDPYVLATLIGDPVKQLNETTIATYKIYIDRISPNITIIASWSHPTFKHGMSIQGINLYTNWGAFWKCGMHYPPYNYFIPQYDPNDAELGSRSNNVANIGNYLEFQITVHFYGYDKTINNSTYTLYVATVVDGVIMDNSSHNFPLSGYYPPGAITSPLVLNSQALNPKVSLGGLAAANATVFLPAYVLTDFSISVIPNTEYLEATYIQQGPRGFDIPNVLSYPKLTNVEYFTRNNVKCARMQLGYILVSGQVYWSTSEDYITFYITIRIDESATFLINQNVSANIILEYNNAGTLNQATTLQTWTIVPTVASVVVTENVTSYFGNHTMTINSFDSQRIAVYLDGLVNYPSNSYAKVPLMKLGKKVL
uniref:Uncharacterized protein n=1 Tax=Romanomermis culicivorax TaxID=13658 RepID=A0A915K983_ROMCU